MCSHFPFQALQYRNVKYVSLFSYIPLLVSFHFVLSTTCKLHDHDQSANSSKA
uniref:Uncharacterized protein n=1 Tax=Arundo donax TaxID=35708 RepID=A0A0A8Y7C9_ARUDO